jgi:glycolate oxidase iron-sulfur subunit
MPPAPDAPPADAARLAALADRCVQCGLCLPHCPTYRLDRIEAEGPRGRIAYVKAVATGALEPTPAGDTHLDHCLGCRRCEAVCPAGVRYGDLLTGARARQFERDPPRLGERATLAALASPPRARVALAAARLVGRLPPIPTDPDIEAIPVAREDFRGSVVLFRGCAGTSYEAGTRRALDAMLRHAGIVALESPDAVCCGTAAAHAGDAAGAAALAARNRAVLAVPKWPGIDLGEPHPRRTILSLATGCESVLAASLAGHADVIDAVEFLAGLGDDLVFRAASTRVALHLPCSQRVLGHAEAIRALLGRVPALDLVELPDTGCCGAAGLHMLGEPARAAALRAPLLGAFEKSGATQLLSANLGCRLHLGNAIKMPVRHPIDFLAEHLA